MNCAHLFLFVFVWLAPSFMNAQPSSQEQPLTSSYLQDLEELGYCVIPQLFSTRETELLYQRIWHEYVEKAWPNCKMDDRSNWKEVFPEHNPFGIFNGLAGHTQVMWDLRQDPRIVNVFAQIWNTSDLIVSMDGISLMCPPEIKEIHLEPWPHVDQATMRPKDNVAHNNNPPVGFISESLLRTQPFTIQGQFLFEDSFVGDGGFYCIPKSHLRFNEFAPELEVLSALEVSPKERSKFKHDYVLNFFSHSSDKSGNPYCMKQITAPRGSLILWDSRTIHWNQRPSKDRPYDKNAKVRMVGYLCYVPKTRLTEEGKAIRKRAFEIGATTGHNPTQPEIKVSKDHVSQEFEQYLEDPSCTQQKIHLTPLGESLLGL